MSDMLSAARSDDSSFKARLQVRCPPTLPAAIEKAACGQLMSSSEYVRRSVIERLKADGIDPAQLEVAQ